VLREIFGAREEVTGEWRKLRTEALHIAYCSPHTVRATKSRRTGMPQHVVRMGKTEVPMGFWSENLTEDHFKNVGVGGG
jgi:hypothetical protein